MKFLCVIFDHSWYYNFSSLPNKRICGRCGKRQALNLRTLNWTESFDDSRTDKELKKAWIREKAY